MSLNRKISSVLIAVVIAAGSFAGNVFADTLIGLQITSPADKLVYTVGEDLDISGLEVTGTYENGDGDQYPVVVSVVEGDITGFNSSAPVTNQTLTISVEGNTASYSVDIVAAPEEPVVEEEEESSRGRSGSRRSSAPAVLGATTDTSSEGAVLGTSTMASSSGSFEVNLSVGMRGADVMRLHEVLAALGFFKVTPTGYFGPITLQAVKDYQTAKGIAFVTGFVGPLTRAELNK